MKLELYSRVALVADIPDSSLKKGDVATLVDYVLHPSGGELGYVLEIFNAIGESIATVVVKESDVEPLMADELLSVRHFAKAL